MTQEEIIEILNIAYPKVQNLILQSKLTSEPPIQSKPSIELHRDIYARVSGIEDMEGEHSSSSKAQYDEDINIIYIYYPNMEDKEDVLRSLIHEYTHYLQNMTPLKKKIDGADGYINSPYEQEAHKNENMYIDKLLKLFN
jgi:hypothetical protein|tara:strand:+ start:72 stop:491 length:420 start_codon:yes stop_codon:yes gene_type:complete